MADFSVAEFSPEQLAVTGVSCAFFTVYCGCIFFSQGLTTPRGLGSSRDALELLRFRGLRGGRMGPFVWILLSVLLCVAAVQSRTLLPLFEGSWWL